MAKKRTNKKTSGRQTTPRVLALLDVHPLLVSLDLLTLEVSDGLVQETLRGPAPLEDQPADRVAVHTRHALCGPDRGSFDQRPEDG